MKILLLTDRMDNGDIAAHVLQLAIQLQRSGAQVSVTSAGGALVPPLLQNGIPHRAFPFCTHNPLRLLLLRRKLKQWLRQEHFDVLHAHAAIPALLMRGLVSTGGLETVTVHKGCKPRVIGRLFSYFGMRTVAVSEDLRASTAAAFGIPCERITVIPNSADTAVFAPSSSAAVRRPYRILFCGHSEREEHIAAELLCQIALSLKRSFPQLQIELVASDKLLRALQRRVQHVNALIGEESIHIRERTERHAQLLQSAEIFVGASRSALEAALCGCAVLLCGNEGYFGPLTEDNLCEAELSDFCGRGKAMPSAARLEQDLRRLLSDRAHTARQAERVRRLLAERRNAEASTLATLALYRKYQTPPCSKVLTLSGRFGYGNMGAESALQGLIDALWEGGFTAHLTVFSGNPLRTNRELGVHCVHRFRMLSVLSAFAFADALLCEGGALSKDSDGNRCPLYELAMLRLAKRFSTVAILLSADIGPSKGPVATGFIANTLRRLSYIGLYGQSAFDYADTLGIDRNRLHITENFAVLLPAPPPSRTLFLLQQNGLHSNSAYLCVFLRSDGTRRHNTARLIATALRIFCKRHNAKPLLMELEPLRDGGATATAQAMLGGTVIPLREPSDAVALMRQSLLSVSMHPHGLLFATMAYTPCIGIPHSAKAKAMQEIAQKTGQEYLPPEQLNAVSLVEKMEWLLQNRQPFCATFPACVEELQKKAKKGLENVMEVIYNEGKKQQQQKGAPT